MTLYLDHAATTPLDPRVVEAMLPFMKDKFGNPSSIHSYGREVKTGLEKAREHVARLIDAQPSEITFTSGGTESDNVGILSAFSSLSSRSQSVLLTTHAEHKAVITAAHHLEIRGVRIQWLPVDRIGRVDMEALLTSLTPGDVVSLMTVNNETGALNPIRDIVRHALEKEVMVHSDIVQAFGKIPLSVREIPLDYASMSAHKINGPKGIGALYSKPGRTVVQLIQGGGQERGRRGGTENILGIIGFGEAARLAFEEMTDRMEKNRTLRDTLIRIISNSLPQVIINGAGDDAVPNIVSISFPYEVYPVDGEMIVMSLDLEGIAVSSGSACTAGSVEPSHVMRVIGHDLQTAKATIRFSFGLGTTESDVAHAAETVVRLVNEMLQKERTPASRSAMP